MVVFRLRVPLKFVMAFRLATSSINLFLISRSFEVILLVSVKSLTALGKSSPNNSKEIGIEGAQRSY